MLSKYSHQKKSIMQTLKPPRYLPVMPISLYLWSIPLRTGTKSQEHHSRLPKVNWRGYCMVGQPHPQVYSPYSSNSHHPGHLLQVSVWWQGLPCLDCTQILQKKDRKCPLVIPYTLVRRPWQVLIYLVPINKELFMMHHYYQGTRVKSNHLLPFLFLPFACLPYPLPPHPVFSHVHTLLSSLSII